MDITLERARGWIIGTLVAAGVLILALIGHAASPVEEGRPQLLTPERWLAASLSRQARAEVGRLAADARLLQALMAQEAPDAIRAMTLAQRIYTDHRRGTTATAPARTALIEAAAAVARYASGSIPRQAAVDAVNAALERIRALHGQPAAPADQQSQPEPASKMRHVVFIPLAMGRLRA